MRMESLVERFFLFAAAGSALATVSVFVFMFFLGLPLVLEGHFLELFTSPWAPDQGVYGIRSMIVGSLVISVLSLIFAFPLSLGCSILTAVLAPGGMGLILRRTVEFMTGIPTVVYGFAGIFLLVPIIRNLFEYGSGMSILTASLLLAVLITPTMVLVFADSFNQVPESYLKAVDALGGSPAQKLLYVIIPCSWQGLAAGVILATGRAMGDTMISLMVAGNSIGMPGSVLDSGRTLTGHIGLIMAADFESLEFKSLFACGLILYLFTSLMVMAVRGLYSRKGFRAA